MTAKTVKPKAEPIHAGDEPEATPLAPSTNGVSEAVSGRVGGTGAENAITLREPERLHDEETPPEAGDSLPPPIPIRPVVGTGPRAPHRVREVPIPDYPGYKMTIWVNWPQRVYDDLVGGDDEKSMEASRRIFISNNGWCDEDGIPYPPMDTQEFWQAIPGELASTMLAVVRKEAAELPNSLLRPPGRSERG